MAAAVHQSTNVNDFLSKKQKESPKDIAADWAEIEELHNKKYHLVFWFNFLFTQLFSDYGIN